jgi:hypothetical protein
MRTVWSNGNIERSSGPEIEPSAQICANFHPTDSWRNIELNVTDDLPSLVAA